MKSFNKYLIIGSALLTLIYTGCGEESPSKAQEQEQQMLLASDSSTQLVASIRITHDGLVYATIASPVTGKIWLDRNLGASSVCSSLDDSKCYGSYYQWGQAKGARFIKANSSDNFDWVKRDDNNGSKRAKAWSKISTDSICPAGYRVPNITELSDEMQDITNNKTAFDNFLKLPSSGYLIDNSGVKENAGDYGVLWSSTVNGLFSESIFFGNGDAGVYSYGRASGFGVRCIEGVDEEPPVFDSNATVDALENQLVAIQLEATDNLGVVIYAISGGDSELLELNATSGLVSFKIAPDFEATGVKLKYTFTATATDEVGLYATQDVIVSVIDELEDIIPPVFLAPFHSTPMENRLTAIDVKANDDSVITYAITRGTNAGDFNINSSTGVVTFKVEPDWETLNFNSTSGGFTHEFYVTATDAFGNSAEYNYTVEVQNEVIGSYESVLSPRTGKVWLDKNLGAFLVCTSLNDKSCYGDYYQWGRYGNTHQLSSSTLSANVSSSVDDSGANDNSDFIGLNDWLSSGVDDNGAKRSANWSKTDASVLCPSGYRVPTLSELKNDTVHAGMGNSTSAFNSFLKLPSAGYRDWNGGSLTNQGTSGGYWTSSPDSSGAIEAWSVGFTTSVNANYGKRDRAMGRSVRCIKN